MEATYHRIFDKDGSELDARTIGEMARGVQLLSEIDWASLGKELEAELAKDRPGWRWWVRLEGPSIIVEGRCGRQTYRHYFEVDALGHITATGLARLMRRDKIEGYWAGKNQD